MGLVTGRKKGDTMDVVGREDDVGEWLVLKQSSTRVVADLLRNLPDGISQATYAQWKEWRNDLLTKFPVGFCAGGLGTECGPQTKSEACFSHFLSTVRSGKVMEKWMGDESLPFMGSVWKPFCTYYPEDLTTSEISRALWKGKNRIPKKFRPWNVPSKRAVAEYTIHSWTTSWSELRSRVANSYIEERYVAEIVASEA